MKVYDLDHNVSTLSLIGYGINNDATRPRSNLHLLARTIIKEVYPLVEVLEEVTITVRRGQTAYLDFFVPQHSLCVEVHGEQHFKFCEFYHRNQAGFLNQKKRDRDKRFWLEINNIRLVEFNYNESGTEWRAKLSRRTNEEG
jgi:hypothetical protein